MAVGERGDTTGVPWPMGLGHAAPAPPDASKNSRSYMPVVWQLRILGCFLRRHGALGTDCEVNPATTLRAATDKPRIIPPGAHQRIVNCTAVVFKAEVDRLHLLPAIGVRTGSIRIDDMWCHLPLLAASSVESVHPLQLAGSRSRCSGGHFGHRPPLLTIAQSGLRCRNTHT